MSIPLENEPELAQKFGIAIAYICLVEDLLMWALLIKSGVNPVPNLITNLFGEVTLGRKISLSKELLDKKTQKKLHTLNETRGILVHGVIGQEFQLTDIGYKPTQNYEINKNSKEFPLNDHLDKTITLAKELIEVLHPVQRDKRPMNEIT